MSWESYKVGDRVKVLYKEDRKLYNKIGIVTNIEYEICHVRISNSLTARFIYEKSLERIPNVEKIKKIGRQS